MITSDQHPSVQLGNSCAQNFSTEISNIRRLVYVATGCSHLSSKRRKKKEKKKDKGKEQKRKGEGEGGSRFAKVFSLSQSAEKFRCNSAEDNYRQLVVLCQLLAPAIELHLQRAFNVNIVPPRFAVLDKENTGEQVERVRKRFIIHRRDFLFMQPRY